MKNYVDGWVHLSMKDLDVAKVCGDLTVKSKDGVKLPLYRIAGDQILLPWSVEEEYRHFGLADLRVMGNPLWEEGTVIFNDDFEYRDGQCDTVRSMLAYLREHKSGILRANPGKGKTVMGAVIAATMGMSTCVLVHKEFLYEQWAKEFKLVAPSLKVGLMQRDRCDTGDDFDVVCAITQSVTNARREYPEDFYQSFGLLICDEVHRYAAEVWQTAITRFPARYRLGLTATPSRADGMWPVIHHHIGRIGSALTGDDLLPRVYQLDTHYHIEEKRYAREWLTETQQRAKLITILAEHSERNGVIVRNILKAWGAKRRILVISDRRIQLELLSKAIRANGVPDEDVGFYVGGKKQEKLNEAARRPVLFGTYGMAQEGLDIPALDVLFFGTPRGRITQIVGRILRPLPGKKEPVVFDLVDAAVPILAESGKARFWQYKKAGYEIIQR